MRARIQKDSVIGALRLSAIDSKKLIDLAVKSLKITKTELSDMTGIGREHLIRMGTGKRPMTKSDRLLFALLVITARPDIIKPDT